jgi:membrane protease subunit (stomatin/prohibitin family)
MFMVYGLIGFGLLLILIAWILTGNESTDSCHNVPQMNNGQSVNQKQIKYTNNSQGQNVGYINPSESYSMAKPSAFEQDSNPAYNTGNLMGNQIFKKNFCKNCGDFLESDAQFCSNCGIKI